MSAALPVAAITDPHEAAMAADRVKQRRAEAEGSSSRAMKYSREAEDTEVLQALSHEPVIL